MKVLLCSVEVSPFAKVGGLADVIGALPKALGHLGHDAIVFMPAYGMVVKDKRYGAKKILAEFPVVLNKNKTIKAELYEIEYGGLKVWLVDGGKTFAKVARSEEVYTPTRNDYLFYSLSAMAACEAMNWIPDIVHSHDWHTAFIPVLMRERFSPKWDSVGATYTIHNLAYQGQFGPDTLSVVDLPTRLFNMNQLETFGKVNFLKAGCVFADQVNTVSPTYAEEITTAEYGCDLHGLMAYLTQQGRLRGILNGIDTAVFDPATDPNLAAHFSAEDPSGKQACRAALCEEFGLDPDPKQPVMGLVSRLSNQKGFDLLVAQARRILKAGRLIVLGTGDPWAARELRRLEFSLPDRLKFVEAFDVKLAQRIYAGSDMFLMPSAFEPCGLGQMIALRYGTIPVVRRTGGLADTVFDGENGFTFEAQDARELAAAVERGARAFRRPDAWSRLVHTAMSQDYGWDRSAAQYVSMYEEALVERTPDAEMASAAG